MPALMPLTVPSAYPKKIKSVEEAAKLCWIGGKMKHKVMRTKSLTC